MRLWSLHPRYLDTAGLVALWREALLAQAVLWGKTRGYRFHPQLLRFRSHPDPEGAIASYLEEVLREAIRRGYRFDATKIPPCRALSLIPVTRGQLRCERTHLMGKLALRAPWLCAPLTEVCDPRPHPLFTLVEGSVEGWERISNRGNNESGSGRGLSHRPGPIRKGASNSPPEARSRTGGAGRPGRSWGPWLPRKRSRS